MLDLQYDANAFRQTINELVPGYQQSAVLSLLESAEAGDKDFDSIGLGLTGEKANVGFVFLTGTRAQENDQTIWGAIKAELYDFLCTKSKRYANERKDGVTTIKHVVVIIATAVSAQFHVAVGVIAGAVTVALMSALKITRNAWCEMNQSIKQ
jgi:hypothetical protein